ncbi:uncharacterized protein LOC107827376 [Nicotiana tabacum]|uniref:Uncharacterized protein LOC107827376 n=1 Tax=Nicotiana tabacum TaxID=4097 RepID=A0A1S4D9C1_TOBAC|nr:PREDICTED: uncharacterized protein LOC107827376 [Nicotiana tabacum]
MSMPIIASRTKSTGEDVSVCGNSFPQQKIKCYEGEVLDRLLTSIKREIATARNSNASLPDKLWLKQQFSVGVNEITRVLERMPPIPAKERSSLSAKVHSARIQVVLVASDCHPRLLTKHLESLAISKKVPIVFVKDKKRGSLRLGELVKLKTAIAIGVKDKGNQFSQFISNEMLHNFE